MGKFRRWHIVAGIAALVLTYILGTAMGLNNTAIIMSSCVAFVAASLCTDSRLSRHRRETAQEAARQTAREAAREIAADAARRNAAADSPAGPEQAREAVRGPYRDRP